MTLFGFFLPNKVFGQRGLEIEYPDVPGAPSLETVETEIPAYVRYIFNFSIWITGLIAFGALIYGGFRYLTSTGKPEAIQDAKNWISAAFLGILILMSSWFILTNINPELKKLQIGKLPSIFSTLQPGIYLCLKDCKTTLEEIKSLEQEIKETENPQAPEREKKIERIKNLLKEISANCWRAPTEGELDKSVNNRATHAYAVTSETGILYGAIFYEKSKFDGKAQVIATLELDKITGSNLKFKPSSVRPFILRQPRTGAHAETYELTDFNRDDTSKKTQKCEINGLISTCNLNPKEIKSLRIEGELMVIFYRKNQGGTWPSDNEVEIDVFAKSDPSLEDNLMGKWCYSGGWIIKWNYHPCAEQMVVVSGGVY